MNALNNEFISSSLKSTTQPANAGFFLSNSIFMARIISYFQWFR